MEPRTITTWRTTLPLNRDAVCLQIIEYRWDEEGNARRFILQLNPEPHWMEYREGDVIPDSTVEWAGDDIYMFGRRHAPGTFDSRQSLRSLVDDRVKVAISAVMDLHPAVEFTDAPT